MLERAIWLSGQADKDSERYQRGRIMRKTCEDCIHNEDLLCDAKGILVKDDDDACRLWNNRGDDHELPRNRQGQHE